LCVFWARFSLSASGCIIRGVKQVGMKCLMSVLAIPFGLAILGGLAWAAPRALKETARVSVKEGTLHDAFSLDETGHKLAHVIFTAQGEVQLHIGPPGGKGTVTNLAEFSGSPEKILAAGGQWFVVSHEGDRRAAIIDASGRIKNKTSNFDDCELSHSPSAFVAYRKTHEAEGDRTTVQVYRPDGGTLAVRALVVTANGTVVGADSTTFLGFCNSHLQAMVQIPGAFNRRTDSRDPPQFGIYDLAARKVVSRKTPPQLDTFLDYIHKRAEKPDQDAVILLAAGRVGFELVGPGEKVRTLEPGISLQDYDLSTLQQMQVGGRVVFSLLADRPSAGKGSNETGRYALAFFSLEPSSAKVTVLGEVPIADRNSAPWSAGGDRIAVLHKNAEGNNEIVIYAK
jgi:hypothetical protein